MKAKMKMIFESHPLLRLGTLDQDGFLDIRSVDFANDPEDVTKLYFSTFINTNKVKQIEADNRVYIVVDKAADTIEELVKVQYVRGTGVASVVENEDEMQKGMGLLMSKYPFMKELPGDPSQMKMYRIDLKEVHIIDNTQGFGHTDTLSFD